MQGRGQQGPFNRGWGGKLPTPLTQSRPPPFNLGLSWPASLLGGVSPALSFAHLSKQTSHILLLSPTNARLVLGHPEEGGQA